MTTYKKDILPHEEFYIVKFTKSSDLPHALFIHGGPGLNCGTIEYLIEHHELFNSLQCNIILYDQRNCGKSNKTINVVLQQDNINDLQKIILHLVDNFNINTQVLIGHSYGAKLLFDFYKKYASTIPGVFVSTAKSILTPRLNNLMLDLCHLKKNNLNIYNTILNEMDNIDLNKIWEISEQLTPVFQENSDRPYLYWANLEYYKLVLNIQKYIKLPLDTKTFLSVRKDLYSKEAHFSVNIEELKIRKLWINGFHDFVMGGHQIVLSNNHEVITFHKSSHYPHLEENDRFSELLNEFIK